MTLILLWRQSTPYDYNTLQQSYHQLLNDIPYHQDVYVKGPYKGMSILRHWQYKNRVPFQETNNNTFHRIIGPTNSRFYATFDINSVTVTQTL